MVICLAAIETNIGVKSGSLEGMKSPKGIQSSKCIPGTASSREEMPRAGSNVQADV